MRKRLTEIIKAIPGIVSIQIPSGVKPEEIEITEVVFDSRQAKPGTIFVALQGTQLDGHQFIEAAVKNGAASVIGSRACQVAVPYIQVTDCRLGLAYTAATLRDFPGKKMTVIGVTGTDGKTTTCNLIYEILKAAGIRAGLITTVNAVIGDQVFDTGFHVTTPEAPEVQEYLARMADNKPEPITHVVLESTSHGLAQQRVAACFYDVAAVTNITHEHLDYHGSFGEYRAAKARLFQALAETPEKAAGNPRTAILNQDDESYSYLAALVSGLTPPIRQVSYGISNPAQVRGEAMQTRAHGLAFQITGQGYQIPVEIQLRGSYNVANALAAWCVCVEGLGIQPEAARAGLHQLKTIPGRMESIELGQSFTAIVDFAHTPNALVQALRSLREMGAKRVIAIFGSAGLRDREKRSLLAEQGAKLADVCVLTAEDPRTEDLSQILVEMKKGAEKGGGQEMHTFWRIPDRREAIRFGVRKAQAGDVVIVLGKGHEQSMCFGDREYPWDDRIAMRSAIAELLGIPGPGMPFLPT